MFPSADKSSAVIEFFEQQIIKKKVELRTNFEVTDITHKDDIFTVNEIFKAPLLVIATGGKSYPTTGTTGDGYRFLENFNHTITELHPCETPLVSSDQIIASKELQGLTIDECDMTIYVSNKKVKKITHSLLFTHFGLSGPGPLHCSYFVLQAFNKQKKVHITINNILTCPNRLKPYLDENGAITINITDLRGFKNAFVTCGGVSLKEINPKTFESKKVPGLFVTGELLDINAFTGGYNLTTCFCEGYCVAKYINTLGE